MLLQVNLSDFNVGYNLFVVGLTPIFEVLMFAFVFK